MSRVSVLVRRHDGLYYSLLAFPSRENTGNSYWGAGLCAAVQEVVATYTFVEIEPVALSNDTVMVETQGNLMLLG